LGSPPTVERDNDKNAVIALREIASESIDIKELHESVIRSMQSYIPTSDDSDAELDSEHQAEMQASEGAKVDQVTMEQMAANEAEEQLHVVDEE
jgi:DNA-directed RNA polymerase subunit omega